jgi:hypothetical protein
METFRLIVVIGFYVLLIVIRIRVALRGSNRAEKLSQDREAALLKAWEDFELGSSRSEKRPGKGPGNVALRARGSGSGNEPGHIVWFTTFLWLGIVASYVVFGLLSGGPEPLTVTALNCGMLTVVCCTVALLMVSLVVLAQAFQEDRRLVSRKPPRASGEGGGVRDEWLDGPHLGVVSSQFPVASKTKSGP